MAEVKIKDLKEGDQIKIESQFCKIIKFEKSNIGKHGKVKCRIETLNSKGENQILIRLEEDTIEKK